MRVIFANQQLDVPIKVVIAARDTLTSSSAIAERPHCRVG